jgi:hypothetical protein
LSFALPAIVFLSFLNVIHWWVAFESLAWQLESFKSSEALSESSLFFRMLMAYVIQYSVQSPFWLIDLGIWVMFSVAWHRRYLIPDQICTLQEAVHWGWRQTRFILVAAALLALAFVVVIVVVLLLAQVGYTEPGIEIEAVILLLIGLPYSRLSLLFPASAVDHRMSVGECWELTEGNSWRLLLIISLVGIPVYMVAVAIGFFLAALGGFDSLIIGFVVRSIYESLSFVGIAFGITGLSIAYHRLVSQKVAHKLRRR